MTLHILMGLPVSGKSTFTVNFKPKQIISTDNIRKEVLGDVNIQDPSIFQIAADRVKKCLMEFDDCVYDATNLRIEHRKEYINMGHSSGHKVNVVFFDISKNISQARNSRRKRKVPVEVIDLMFDVMERPTYKEGMDEITIL